jgi:hypothetical protein
MLLEGLLPNDWSVRQYKHVILQMSPSRVDFGGPFILCCSGRPRILLKPPLSLNSLIHSLVSYILEFTKSTNRSISNILN